MAVAVSKNGKKVPNFKQTACRTYCRNQEVFEPLEMHATVADWTDSLIMHRAAGYGMDRGKIINAPYVDNSYKWAGGGFLSSASGIHTEQFYRTP